MKLLEENVGKIFLDINCSNIFSNQSPKAKDIKAKINKEPNQTSKLLHSKGKHKQDEKTTLRMGENICK